ncbi:hypothetical protein SDC9_76364 [bioreactor metagenome]|uniref:Uncharacterized protein n=1 Tax=bioreactor metagenome TaxID=1076179 RepID=A0A644YTM9_9ZZZZ
MMRHIKLKMSFMLDKVAVCELRGQLSYYIKGKKHSAQCREKLNSAEKCEDIIEILTQWNALDGGGTDD